MSMRSSESLYSYTYDRHYICICKAHIISNPSQIPRYPYINNHWPSSPDASHKEKLTRCKASPSIVNFPKTRPASPNSVPTHPIRRDIHPYPNPRIVLEFPWSPMIGRAS